MSITLTDVPTVDPIAPTSAPEWLARVYILHTQEAREACGGSPAAYCQCYACDDFRDVNQHFATVHQATDFVKRKDAERAQAPSMTELFDALTKAIDVALGTPDGNEAPNNVTDAKRPYGKHGAGCDCE